MTQGIRISNPTTGSIQFDEENSNHVLIAKGTATTRAFPANNTGQPGFSQIDVPVPSGAQFPIIVFPAGVSAFGSTWTAGTIGATSVTLTVMASVGASITYYLFDYPTVFSGPLSGWGWRIKDAAHNILYHSDLRPLRIVEVYSGLNYSTSPPSRTYPSGRTYGWSPVILGRREIRSVQHIGINQRRRTEFYGLFPTLSGASFSATERYFNAFQFDTNGNPGQYNIEVKSDKWAYMIVDLTGYP